MGESPITDGGVILYQLVKKLSISLCFLYNKGNGGVFMDQWRKDARKEPIIIDINSLVPAEHLLRKIEKAMSPFICPFIFACDILGRTLFDICSSSSYVIGCLFLLFSLTRYSSFVLWVLDRQTCSHFTLEVYFFYL